MAVASESLKDFLMRIGKIRVRNTIAAVQEKECEEE